MIHKMFTRKTLPITNTDNEEPKIFTD